MTERRKSIYSKDNNPDHAMLHYLNTMQSKTKRNSIVKLGNSFNKTNVDTRKRASIQLTNQDIEKISEKINESIFLQTDPDLNQLITTTTAGSINNQRKSIILSLKIPPNPASPERNNSRRTTTKTVLNVITPLLPKRQYKNSQDLFSQTLNFKLKHRSEITNQLLLNTQLRILNKKQKKRKNDDNRPMFNNTIQLNKYIINQYHIGNNSSDVDSKQKVSEETFSLIRQKKIKEIKQKNKTELMMTLENTTHKYTIDSNDCSFNNYNEERVADLKRQYYENRKKQRLNLANTFLRKLEDLSNIQYQQMDNNNLINYKNLSRVIQVMRIKEQSKCNSINKQKLKLKEDEAEVILATSKLGPPLYAKTKLKKETHVKFFGAKGSYFGYPV